MAKIETQYVLVGRDETKRAMSSFRRNVTRAHRAVFNLQSALVGLGAAATVRSIAAAGLSLERIERGLRTATGSGEAAAESLSFLRGEADRLGLDLESSATAFAKLSAAAKGTALEGKASRDIFVAISEASRVLGLSTEQTSGALTAIEQIISKGKVSAEELRGQLGERLPGAFQIAARALGVTTSELDDMLKRGELLAEDLLPALAAELRRTVGPEVAAAAGDAAASFGRFSTAVFELKAAIAQSGLLDTLADAAEKSRQIAIGLGAIFLNAGPAPFDKQIADLQEKLAGLQEQVRSLVEDQGITDSKILDPLLNEILTTSKRLDELKQKSIEAMTSIRAAVDSAQSARASATSPASVNAFPELTIESDLDRALKGAGLRDTQFDVQEFTRTFEPLQQEIESTRRVADDLGLTFASAFGEAIVEGGKFRDLLQGLLRDILQIAAQTFITKPLGGFFSGLFNSFGGPKAAGGPVAAGTGYLVGEQGPELFVPHVSGHIIPNGAGGVVMNYNIDARGADEARIMRIMPAILKTAEDSAVNRIVQLRGEGRL